MIASANISKQSLHIQFSKIWQQNVSVGQIVIALVFNFMSYYFQDILLIILPNALLLILYLILNNTSFSIVSNGEKGISLESQSILIFLRSLLDNKKVSQFNNSVHTSEIYDQFKYLKLKEKDSFSHNSFQNSFICNREVPPVSNVLTPTSTSTSYTITTYTNTKLPELPASTITTQTQLTTVSYSQGFTTISYPYSGLTTGNTSAISTTSPNSVVNSTTSKFSVSTASPLQSCDPELSSSVTVPIISDHLFPPDLSLPSETNVSMSYEKLDQPRNVISNSNNLKISKDGFKSGKMQKVNDCIETKSSLQKCELNVGTNIQETCNLSPAQINAMLNILPKFSGELNEYKSFKNCFKVLVDHQNLSPADKGFLLYSSLDRNVIDILGNVTLNDHIEYNYLWGQLDYEFSVPLNGPYYISNNFNDLDNWPICDTLCKLTKLYEFLLSNYRALEREQAHKNDLVVAMKVLALLSGDLVYDVASIIDKHPNNPILPDILKIIKEEIHCLQLNKLADNCKFKTNKSSTFPESCFSQTCVFCKSTTHISDQCNKFNKPSDFHSKLFQNFRCFNCLDKQHKSYNCPMKKLCKFCDDPRPHNPLICNKNTRFH